jgi:hypothetical protein
MSLTTEQAARLVLASAIRDAVGDAVEEIRQELRPELNPGDRATAWIDGVNVGAVAMNQTKPAAKVVNYAALMAWAMEHAPAAIIHPAPTLNGAWVTTLLKGGGEWTDPQTGEVFEVPGLGVTQASPNLVVTKTDAVRAWALTALDATMHSPLAITGGTDA